MTLDQIMAHAAKTARDSFRDRGYVVPMWAGHTASGELIMIMPDKFTTGEQKQIAVDKVRAIFKEKGVVMFAFMTEAWMIDSAQSSQAIVARAWFSGKSLEHHPDRREAIYIQAEDKERCIIGHYFILRPEHGKPTLSPFRKGGSLDGVGRMFGLLREKVMAPGMKYAPWSAQEVENLNRYQRWGKMHEFTCPNGHVLLATRDGWVCVPCAYMQDWAHEFMTTFTEDQQKLMDTDPAGFRP